MFAELLVSDSQPGGNFVLQGLFNSAWKYIWLS